MVTELAPDRRYTIISSDAHAGADIADYRPYLAGRWHDEFDAWADAYVNPFADLLAPTAYRSWDSDRRLAENDADGIAAEVLFPNSVPPFFEEGSLVALPPTEAEYERRWAGIQAHNRWLAEFCARVPGRRAGVVQIFANHIDDAIVEVRWAASTFAPFGGILLPSLPPDSGLPAPVGPVLRAAVGSLRGGRRGRQHPRRRRHPRLRRCRSGPGHHAGGAALVLPPVTVAPHLRGRAGAAPALKVALTEQGLAWLPRGLETLDWFYGRMTLGNAAEANFFGAAAKAMSMTPTEYFRRNVSVGASFLRASESELRHEVGVDRIMWGADYPHSEGSYPYSREALRAAFGSCDPLETQRMLESNAAALYGFDLDACGRWGTSSAPRWPRSPPRSPSRSTPPTRPATPSTVTRSCVRGRGG